MGQQPAYVEHHRRPGAAGHRGHHQHHRRGLDLLLRGRRDQIGDLGQLPRHAAPFERGEDVFELFQGHAGLGQREHATDRPLLARPVGDGDTHLLRVRPPGGQLRELPAGPQLAFDVLRHARVSSAGVREPDVPAALVGDGRRHPPADPVGPDRDVDVDELPARRQRVDARQGEVGAKLVHDELQGDAPGAAASHEQKASH